MITVRKIAGRIVIALGLFICAMGLELVIGGAPAMAGVAPSATGAIVVAAAPQQGTPRCCIDYSATSCAYTCTAYCSQALDVGDAVALPAPIVPIAIGNSFDSIRSIDGDLMFRPPRPVS